MDLIPPTTCDYTLCKVGSTFALRNPFVARPVVANEIADWQVAGFMRGVQQYTEFAFTVVDGQRHDFSGNDVYFA